MTTILVVEDEALTADDIQRTLARLGYEVPTPAGTAAEALDAAERLRPDLVLIDIKLRGTRDGIEAGAEIRRRFGFPIVYLTSQSDDATFARAIATSPHGYLLKPFHELELRIAIEVALRKHEVESQLAAIVESSHDAIIGESLGGVVTSWNRSAARIFGYSAMEMVGRPCATLCLPGRRDEYDEILRRVKLGEEVTRLEVVRRRKDGQDVVGSLTASPIRDLNGKVTSVSKVIRDLTAEKEAESRTRASLREKEVLLREVHHRVKNNLQVIASLISLQLRGVANLAAHDALEECRARVLAIALIHEQLYQSSDYGQVPFSDYIHRLADNVFHATGSAAPDVKLQLGIESIALPVDKAIPCGLILNELITNALKHAFPEHRCGTIVVELGSREGRISLSVRDDGIGLPDDFDIQRSRGLGLELIVTLAEQLEARLDIERGAPEAPGATFRLSFALEE
jgi:PAS domain S-box-containing protein